jgi:hypothetical protein
MFRESNLARNVENVSDILSETEPYRQAQLANNVPSTTDVLQMSDPFRDALLAMNIPNNTDLLALSFPYLNAQLAMNVPSTSDVLVDSAPYLQNQLAMNIPSTSDVLVDSAPYLQNQLAMNIPSSSNVLFDSEPMRQDALSRNVPSQTRSLVEQTEPYRTEQLARNRGLGLLGVDIYGLGTQTFLGVSRNFALGLIVREILMTRNKLTPRNPYDESNARDNSLLKSGEYTAHPDSKVGTVKEARTRQFKRNGNESIAELAYNGERDMGEANKFNTQWTAHDRHSPQAVTDTMLMAKDVLGNPIVDEKRFQAGPNKEGIKGVTKRIMNSRTQVGDNHNYGAVFFKFKRDDGEEIIRRQRWSVKNPFSSNGLNGKGGEAGHLPFYFTNYAIPVGKAATMYFPAYIQSFTENETANWNAIEILGRPEPMYTYNNSTRTGSISFYVLTDFAQEVELGLDYSTDGVPTIKYNFDNKRFTGVGAKTMSKDDSEKATYTSDRTMALETRKQEIMDKIAGMNLDASASLIANSQLSDNEMVTSSDPFGGSYVLSYDLFSLSNPEAAQALRNRQDADKMQEEMNQIDLLLAEEREKQTGFVRLAESNGAGLNVYDNIIHTTFTNDVDKTTIKNVVERLDDMKKDLLFQPTYFTGDKTDFISRMTFLSRMTKPTANAGTKGFSFTKPPVCHMRLGDYIHHDVVITSISKDYTDSNWTTESGAVQPMWCQVTISFNIIGQYNASGRPLTASDEHGYYDRKPQPVWEPGLLEYADPTGGDSDTYNPQGGKIQYNSTSASLSQAQLLTSR